MSRPTPPEILHRNGRILSVHRLCSRHEASLTENSFANLEEIRKLVEASVA